MSVTGFMYNINATKKLGELELQEGLEGSQSWHHQFKDSAYIYIGGLHPGLTEGDVIVVFSQFGEIVDVNLIRDQQTGKSKGFCFICYEDQRSTVLAVDNMNGFSLLKRTLRVDHCGKYKAPKKLDEENLDENGDPTLLEYSATGAEGKGIGVCNVVKSQQSIEEARQRKKKPDLAKAALEDEDEAWAKAFDASLAQGKKKKKDKKDLKKEKKELKKVLKEAKRLKKENKKAKKDTKGVKKERGAGKSHAKKQASSSSSDDSEDSSASSSPKRKKSRR